MHTLFSDSSSFSDIISYNRLLEGVVDRLDFPKQTWQQAIEDACERKGKDARFVVEILKAFDDNQQFPKEELMRFPLEHILHYLKATHHYYINKKLPEIEQTFYNLIDTHHSTHADLVTITSLFIDYKKELTEHIVEEETKLFPYIDYLIKAHAGQALSLVEACQSENSIEDFIDGHEDVEKSLSNIRKMILYYAPKSPTAMPFRVFLLQLEYFERDLNRHAMVEDEVLIPLAQQIEAQLRA